MLYAALFARMTNALRFIGGVQTWLIDTRHLLRKLEEPPGFLLASAKRGAEGVEDTPALALFELATGVSMAKRALRTAAPFLDVVLHPNFRKLVRAPDTLEATVWIIQLMLKNLGHEAALASELMALSVAAKLEAPTDDPEGRLNTWAARLRRIRPKLNVTIDLSGDIPRKALAVFEQMTLEAAIELVDSAASMESDAENWFRGAPVHGK
ncbi:MAG: hypothetical protein QM723_12960 [Myxococcaceae bacterium]